ncbi:MAG: hypothetical protein K6G15_00635 [Desulfovibrio sp.]|nr:hypothetical protein [Desulfovibrio sp.]
MDTAALNRYADDVLTNFEQHVQLYIRQDRELSFLPPGLLRLEGEALRKAKETFAENLPGRIAALRGNMDPKLIVFEAFEQAINAAGLLDKGTCLLKLEKQNLEFANAGQKDAFISWVCSATSLKSPEAMLAVYRQARAQSTLFYDIANSEQPPKAADLLRQMEAITRQARVDFEAIQHGKPDAATHAANAAFVTRLFMQTGNQEVDAAVLAQLAGVLNSPAMREMTAQLSQLAANPEIAKTGDGARLADLANGVVQLARQVAAFLGQPYEAPATLQNISMMPAEVRELVREIAPEAGAKMDELCPTYAPFPQPAQPDSMPSTEPQRRAFLVKTLDVYGTKELNTEEFVHGRGHITRAYIFANAMCNILAEDGVEVDRNAVLCGITGHDLGREGAGDDLWEEQSAGLTTQAMREAFGQDAMGGDYENAVGNCIQRGKTETVEAMLLKSADSLDIGRTVEFDTKYFPFLGDKDPNKDNAREPDKYTVSSPKARELREQLVKEAKILEIITDPNTRYRDGKIHLMEQFYTGTQQQNALIQQQYLDLVNDVLQEYKSQWTMDSDSFVQNVENIVLKNPDIFPTLSRYYKKD